MNKTAENPPRFNWIMITAILLLALGLRLIHLDSMEFKGDEAFNLMRARELAHLRSFPLTSATSSTGIPEPPIFMYLLSLPIFISDDAIFVTGAIAVLNVFAILLCYILVRRYISPLAALISALLFAVNPWQVLYSRKIWTQNLLPFFSLLFLLLMFEAVFRNKPRLVSLALITLALAVQLHLSAAFMIPYAIVFLLWQRRMVRLRDVMLGMMVGLILFLPYFIYLGQHAMEISRIIMDRSHEPFVLRSSAVFIPLQLATTSGFAHETVLFSSYATFIRGMVSLTSFEVIARLLLLLGLIIGVLHRSAVTRALAGYALLGIAYIFASNTQIFPHYYNAQLPVFFILISLPTAALISMKKRLPAVISAFVICLLLVSQLYFTYSILQFISHEDCIWSEYGPPYRVQVAEVAMAVSELERQGIPPDFKIVHERVSSCVNWDIKATEYLVKRFVGWDIRSGGGSSGMER